jgi:hypothetical protein
VRIAFADWNAPCPEMTCRAAEALWLDVTIDAGEAMNDLIAWRIMCRHLILGFVFVPAFALLLREKAAAGRTRS